MVGMHLVHQQHNTAFSQLVRRRSSSDSRPSLVPPMLTPKIHLNIVGKYCSTQSAY